MLKKEKNKYLYYINKDKLVILNKIININQN